MHISKYNRSEVGHIIAHNENTYARSHRENVNVAKTKNNYNILATDKSAKQLLNECLSQVHCSKRKDLNVVASVVVTAPENLPSDREYEFFYHTCKFLSERYEHSQPISAVVHTDEHKHNGRVHLHYLMVPISVDSKGREKVCCKEVITKADLTTLHTDYKKYIDNAMGMDLPVLNGATVGVNKTVNELKAQTLQDDVKKLEKLKHKLKSQIEYELCR